MSSRKKTILDELELQIHPFPVEDVIYEALVYYSGIMRSKSTIERKRTGLNRADILGAIASSIVDGMDQ